jgi:hypothetical protein
MGAGRSYFQPNEGSDKSDARTAEENGKLRDRAKELVPLWEQLMEAYEELKSLLYNGGA